MMIGSGFVAGAYFFNTIKMKEYKTPLSVRGDMLCCPLSFSLDSYWGCVYDCHLKDTWEGISDFEEGKAVMFGTTDKIYTMKDAGFENEQE